MKKTTPLLLGLLISSMHPAFAAQKSLDRQELEPQAVAPVSNERVRYKKPKDTISCAVVLVMNEKEEVLLLRRKGTSIGYGKYGLPGGKVESGETALEAARREVHEELCIAVDQLTLIHVVDYQGKDTESYAFFFKAGIYQGIVTNGEPHKCDHLDWFLASNLPENMVDGHRQAIELGLQGITYSEHGW